MSQETFTLKAGSVRPFFLTGKFLNVLACTAAVNVELDQQGQNSAVAGSSIPGGDGFKKITFTETSGADNTITFDAALTSVSGRAQVISANSSTFVGPNSGFRTFTGGVPYPGVDSQGRHRKGIYISNKETVASGHSLSMVIGIQEVLVVPPGAPPVYVETDANLELLASSGTYSVDAAILEIFYSKPLQNEQ